MTEQFKPQLDKSSIKTLCRAGLFGATMGTIEFCKSLESLHYHIVFLKK